MSSGILDDIKSMLVHDEGWKNKPYKCPAGKITIGVGHNLEANGLDDWVIEEILKRDIESCKEVAFEVFGRSFSSFKRGRKLAIINMIFQLGPAGFKRFKRTIRAMKEGRWEDAAHNALASLWAKQTPNRAMRVIEMLRTGENVY